MSAEQQLRRELVYERRRSAALARELARERVIRAEVQQQAVASRQDLARIVAAWDEPGPLRAQHRHAQRETARLMPVLVRRIRDAPRRM